MRKRSVAVGPFACLVITIAFGASAFGQVLHEKVRVEAAGGAQPEAGEQVFSPQPETPVEVGGAQSQTASPADHPPDRRDIIRSDRDTGPEPPGTHDYHVVFDPAPFPFKRMTALDAVRITPCPDGRKGCDDEVLVVADRTLWPVPLFSAVEDSARERFSGSIVIDFEPGRWVPIPSVAADIRILRAATTPPIAIEFARDGADNYFVRSPSGGRHRLNWVSSAPSSYFGGALPAGVKLEDEPRALLRKVPPRLERRVERVLAHAHIRVRPHASLESVLDPLVAYFRAFQLGTLPPPTGSSYCDLALGQKGCCRHRSYAFAITAMAIGIPVRYLENEVHVFVEVFVPKRGWRRINLGGAPLDEQLLGGDGKTLHRPQGIDPFPEPPAFLAAAAPPPKGLDQLASSRAGESSSESGGSSPASGAGGASPESGAGSSSAEGAGGSSPESGAGGARPKRATVNLAAIERADQASVQAEAAEPAAERRAPTHITVSLSTASTFRGDSVVISGVVRADGAPAGGLPVEIYLAGAGGAVRVAELVTAADGQYHASVEVPADLPLGDHRVVARTRGDARRAPSTTH